MEIRKRISWLVTILCTSFTVIMLLYCVLWPQETMTPRLVYELFAVCAAVSGVVLLTSFLPMQSMMLQMGVYFAETFATVFLFGGGILKLFPFTFKTMLLILGMLTAAYLCVVAAIMTNEKMCSDEINQKIAKMKGKNRSQNQ